MPLNYEALSQRIFRIIKKQKLFLGASKCLPAIHITMYHMSGVSLAERMRTRFKVFPLTSRENSHWSDHQFPYVEKNLDRDYGWLRGLRTTIAAMKAYVKTGDCERDFSEVGLSSAFDGSTAWMRNMAWKQSAISEFAARWYQSRARAPQRILQ